MADGAIARRTKSDSELGARLDTVADIVFVAACFAKIMPSMQFPVWLWIWIVIIAIIKIGIFFGGVDLQQKDDIPTYYFE